MKIKFLLLSLLLAIGTDCFSKGILDDNYNPNRVKHSLYYHQALFSDISNAGWRSFVSTYNAYNTPVMPLTDFRNLSSFVIGYRYGGEKFNLSLEYQHTAQRSEAEYDMHEFRRFDYENECFALGGSYRLYQLFNERFAVNLVADFRFGGLGRIISSYIYRDGTQSYGSDQNMNGTFLNSGMSGLEAGINLSYRILKGMKLELQYVRQMNNLVAPSTWSDNANIKLLNGSNISVIQIPTDYQLYKSVSPEDFILQNGKVLESNFSGNKIAIGLSYNF